MKILKLIWTFINSKLFGYAIGIIVIIFIAQMCHNNSNLKHEVSNQKQNQYALMDTLTKEKLKNGSLQVSIAGFISSEKDLKSLNRNLYDEIQLQEGKVISLNKIVVSLKQDANQLSKYADSLKTVINKPIKINDSTYIIPWTLAYKYDKDSTNYDIFEGQTKIGLNNKLPIQLNNEGSKLISRNTQIELVWGQKWEKGKLKIFANSSYPGFSAKSLEGVLIDQSSKKHWFNGFSVNIGIMPTYDFINKKTIIVIGPCIGYSIYNW
jgi:hypothetical protein